jgi:hypothetical protein
MTRKRRSLVYCFYVTAGSASFRHYGDVGAALSHGLHEFLNCGENHVSCPGNSSAAFRSFALRSASRLADASDDT